MVSLTRKTKNKRRQRKKVAGSEAKAQRSKAGSTPAFPIHPEDKSKKSKKD